MKKLLRNTGLVERGRVVLERGGFKIFSSVFLQKRMFSLLLDFYCLVNIHACCNLQSYSFMWFNFYQKMIYYEISFPLTLIFNYNFVKISLLMTFPFPFHEKLQIFLKINHRCLKEVIEQLLYIIIFIIMNLKFK